MILNSFDTKEVTERKKKSTFGDYHSHDAEEETEFWLDTFVNAYFQNGGQIVPKFQCSLASGAERPGDTAPPHRLKAFTAWLGDTP